LALVYEWRSGALDWGNKTRTGLKDALKSSEVK